MPPSSRGASLFAASLHFLPWSTRSQPYLIFMLGSTTHQLPWHTGLTATISGGNAVVIRDPLCSTWALLKALYRKPFGILSASLSFHLLGQIQCEGDTIAVIPKPFSGTDQGGK